MALEDYKNDVEACSRCSSCKWIPHNQVKSWRFAKNCPSMCRYNFHAYSGSGKLIMVNSIINGRSELTEGLAEIIYKCQMCGACDAACKVYRDDIDSTEILLELRAYCVEQGQLIIEHMAMIDAMKNEDNVLGEPKAKRGEWAEGLAVKNVNTEQAEVFMHVGCRYSYDEDLRDTVRGAVRLMQQAGVDLAIAGSEESCCGGRAYELGYRGEAENYFDDLVSRIKASGASTVVTPCADCFSHLRYLYPRMGKELPEVLHTTQFLERLVDQGKLRLGGEVPMRVTYHDPCHLGRMSEPFTADWKESKLERPMNMKRAGTKGIYDTPRNLIEAIPGMQLVEMERIRQYAFCCGAGSGVLDAFPDFAAWTANERIEEALATGAEALVTACPWCERSFKDSVAETGAAIAVYDLTDLAMLSAGVREPVGARG